MRIRLTLRRPDGSRANVQIVADGTATAGDMAAALAAGEDGRADPGRRDLTLRLLGSRGEGATLAPATPVLEAGLRSGATVELAHAAAAGKADRGSVGALLRVVTGPNSGLEVQLPIGSSDFGRSHDCDVRVNDPLVSKRHARINVGDRVDIVDTNSANGVVIGGVRVARATLGNGDLVTVGATTFTVSQLQTSVQGEATSDVAFVRPPRVLERPRSESMALPDAPRAPRASFFPWVAMMAPLLMGTVMFAFNRTPQAVLFIMMSPVMMAGSFFGQKVDSRRQLRLDLATFEKDLERVTTEVRHAHDREREQLLNVHPSVAQCVQAAASLSPVMWSRRPEHPEFLQTRLGIGAVEPKCIVERPKRVGVPECVDKVVAAHQSLLTLRDAPVVADLRSVGGIGLSGDRGPVDDVARALVAQIAILHSPAEVVLCVLTSSAGRQRWSWLEWLPHVASPHSPVSQHLVADAISGTSLLGQIEDVIDVRRQASGATAAARGPLVKDEDRPQSPLPAVVVIVDESLVDRGRLTRVAERGPDFGVFVVWVATSRHVIPGACRTFVDIGSTNPVAGMVRTEKTLNPLHCEGLDLATAAQVARQLAPVTDSGAPTDDDSDVPRSVPLVALYDDASPDDPEAVLAGWRENGSLTVRDGTPALAVGRPAGLRALVGHTGSEKFALDLRTQGPHALVGGTTGAGKSEFLQAWVLGLARAYSPDRVAFLFVDYKGGSAFARCVDLPHTVGMVTDLSPYLVQRALKSLRAELRFREHLLNDRGKKDLIDLERTGDPDCPPSLIIVVDEFAALVGEVPEFVDGVVDVAQRGRSLGLHLILATQRPAGVIKDNLRANTNLRIALRMADESDSSDVLGTPMAAHFDPGTPGRGAAKTGPGRIMQFQSAYPGSRTPATPQAPPIQVSSLDFGAGRSWTPPAVKSAPAPVATDLDRITASIAAAAQLGRVPAPRKPWLDSLADIYNLRLLTQRSDDALVLGVLDDPENQRQIAEHFRPDVDGNILYYGATGSGKSAALRTLAAAAAILPRGGVIHVYALDFASGALASLETLPHVGAVIRGEDEERIRRLIRRLVAVVDERTERFSAVRAATLKDYRELAGAPNEPRILVLVDGFGAFRSEYEGSIHLDAVYTAFLKIVGEGRALGIHVAMTADRPNAVPTTVAASFLRRVVLRQADEDGYLALGVPRDILTPASPPGRALQADKPQELQLAIFGGERSVAVQARLLEELAQTVAHKLPVRPEPVRALPALITAAQVPASVAGRPVVGVSDESLQPIGFDPSGPILVAGGAQVGKTSALRWFAESLHRAYPRAELFHFSHRKSPLSGLALWRESQHDPEQSVQLASRLASSLASPPPDTGPGVVVIIENLPAFVDGPVDDALRELAVLAKKHGHPIVADGDTSDWTTYSDLLREFRSARTGLVLKPSTDDADNLLNTPTPRTRPADFPPGRGYWIASGKYVKVQIPVAE
ncbi:FtsK/SpoIIIE domain-containing protein [Nostocoides vanveenii]|uniref:FtsK/SpoIIIE domain-containing protein n=1 Tax=Nostocoides vanveenii TaxID=330835 RepID=A0ABN2JZD8_9MICO